MNYTRFVSLISFLQVDDIVTVLETPMNGSWRGDLNGKIGEFPFTHVQWLDEVDD